MCGIVGCVGHENAVGFAVRGLESIDYRGYDSAGIAFPDPESEIPRLKVYKSLGRVTGLAGDIEPVDQAASTAIGHTRWATHGGVTIPNSHPHTNEASTIAVVHNGIITNHESLRKELIKNGYSFNSETDTEVIPHLFDKYLKEGLEPEEAFAHAIADLEGEYAVLAMRAEEPDKILAAKLGGPLILGVNGHEHFASSDARAWVTNTKKAIYLEDEEMAVLSTDGYRVRSLHGKSIKRSPEILSHEDFKRAELGNHPHWMIKEIMEQSETIRDALRGRVRPEQGIIKLGGLEDPEIREKLRQTERLIIVACGTSYHAGLVGEMLIEEIAGLPVEVKLASGFQARSEPIERGTAVLAISQSGETADTISAIRKSNQLGLLSLGVVNAAGSTIDKLTKAGVHCNAGEEKSVASTKAFTSQVTVLAEMALHLSRSGNQLQEPLMEELVSLPEKIEQVLGSAEVIQEVAKRYADYENFLYIGRGYNYPTALEGALKLKEISYINAGGCDAGEMKHGTLALIDENFPTFAIATSGLEYEDTISNIQEVKARGGPIIAIATEGDEAIGELADDVIYVPASLEQVQPILNTVVTQLFAYYVALERGTDIDRPRNLAKSVTVK